MRHERRWAVAAGLAILSLWATLTLAVLAIERCAPLPEVIVRATMP